MLIQELLDIKNDLFEGIKSNNKELITSTEIRFDKILAKLASEVFLLDISGFYERGKPIIWCGVTFYIVEEKENSVMVCTTPSFDKSDPRYELLLIPKPKVI